MKLVCMTCESYLLYEGQEDIKESLGITFKCPRCGYRLAMVTNPGETQLIHSMGIRIGGRTSVPDAMELTRSTLKGDEEGAIEWTEEAETRLEKVPPFIRPMAKMGIEKMAKEKGYKKITPEVMDEAKGKFMG